MDYGGVMTSSLGGAFAAFCVEHGIHPDVFKRVIQEAYLGVGDGEAEGSMITRVETGALSDVEFERWLAGVLSEGLARPLDPVGLRDRLFAPLRSDERMATAVLRARAAGLRKPGAASPSRPREAL